MARTLDPAVHALRRDEFVDVALRLMQTKGWDATSIRTSSPRPAPRRAPSITTSRRRRTCSRPSSSGSPTPRPPPSTPRSTIPTSRPSSGSQLVFGGIARWKSERTELLMAIVETWSADDNAIVREKFRKGVVRRMVPLLASIIAQGQTEGPLRRPRPGVGGPRARRPDARRQRDRDGALLRPPGRHDLVRDRRDRASAPISRPSSGSSTCRAGSLVLVDRDALIQWFG